MQHMFADAGCQLGAWGRVCGSHRGAFTLHTGGAGPVFGGPEKAILSRDILTETRERWGVSPRMVGGAAFSGVSLVCLWEA